MPSLIPTKTAIKTTNSELELNAEINALANPFESDDSALVKICERVLNFLDTINDKNGGLSSKDIDAVFYIEEFRFGMPTLEAVKAEFKLIQAIYSHAEGKLTDAEIKTVLVAYVEAHTTIWRKDGFDQFASSQPFNKQGSYTEWTKYIDLFHITFYSEHTRILNGTYGKLQGWLMEALWVRRDLINNTEWQRLWNGK